MAADEPGPERGRGLLDDTAKLLSMLSLAVGVVVAVKAFPLDAEIKALQAEAARLENTVRQNEAELKAVEAQRRLTLELYDAVRKVLERRDKDDREEEAVRVLVESLADDPFRWRLLQALARGAASPEVRRKAEGAAEYYKEQADLPSPANAGGTGAGTAAARSPAAGAGRGAAGRLTAVDVDFFYCETSLEKNQPLAQAAAQLNTTGPGRWRARLLPEEVNERSSYRVNDNIIRFDPGERAAAEALQAELAGLGVQFRSMQTGPTTPGYLSAFFCAT